MPWKCVFLFGMCKQGKIICIFEGGGLKITEDGDEDATM